MEVGVSLSHLNLLLLTASDSSPIRSHDREYASPSVADPLGVISSISVGAVYIIRKSYYITIIIALIIVTHIETADTIENPATSYSLTGVLAIARW